VTLRLRFVLFTLVLAVPAVAQDKPATDLKRSIDSLAVFDYATRVNAARVVRRALPAEAVPALAQAVRGHSDQFVRYRALVLLTAFNDPKTPELMRTLLADRNDRVREVAYRWFERYPDARLTGPLLAALDTEQAEFVRPALIRALAVLPSDDRVQRALTAEAGRGLDFFRSAVIEALGEHRAAYAVQALLPVAATEGPLQDDAVLALGRIGDRRAVPTLTALTNAPQEVAPTLQAAQCLLGDNCAARITWLTQAARSPAARPETARAALAALGAVASQGNPAALDALMGMERDASGRFRGDLASAFAAVALRRPGDIIPWLGRAADEVRARAIELLHEGFDSLEEVFAEEQFFAAVRAAYWSAAGAETRTLTATLIDKLEF
jgi:HEAT repeat protein